MSNNGTYRLYRSAHRGIAGVVYLLGRLARMGYITKAAKERAKSAIQWLLNDEQSLSDEYQLPGLNFGSAGVAVAICEAISAGFMVRDNLIDSFLSKSLNGKLDWPDITHGAAGQGIAVFNCADRLHDARLLNVSHRYANYLVKSQKNDGSWKMPDGVDGMSGQTLHGFAHGVAGIVYFLSEYARRFRSTAAEKSWESGAKWLIKQAHPSNNGSVLEWSYASDMADYNYKWWCHGSPGIALTFLM